jgi:hypothetical protein
MQSTDRPARVAAARRIDHRVHPLGGPDDGIERAGGDALGTAYAKLRVDSSDVARTGLASAGIKCWRRLLQQFGQSHDTRLATRGATVDRRRFVHDGPGVGLASGVAALGALGLGQQRVDALDETV